MKKFLAVLAVVAVVSMAGSVFAYNDVQLKEVGVDPGTSVSATFPYLGSQSVQAGYYQLSINDGTPINGFCVDPSWSNSNDSTYSLIGIPSLNYERAAWILDQARAGTTGYTDHAQDQIAVWELVMDTNNNIYSGAFYVNSGTYDAAQAAVTAAVSALPNWDPNSSLLSNYVLAVSPPDGATYYGVDYQDYLIPAPPGIPVPEPMSILLLGVGFAGLAGVRRFKKQIVALA